jgi:transposase
MGIRIRALVEGVDQFIGIDHHKRRSHLLIKDREGRVVKRGDIATSRETLSDFLGDGEGLVRSAVFEAGARYRPLARWLRELVDQTLMANPSRLKIISETAYKDDKIDTEKLTDLSLLGLIPEAYICSDEAWDRRMLLRQRVAWVRMRSAVKNRIHGLVDLHPDAEPPRPAGTDLFGLMGLGWLEGVALPKVDRQRLDQLLEGYRFLTQQIRRSDREVRRIVKADGRCEWLKTVPGIGHFFAALIVAEIDDIRRFRKSKHFVSYTGLVPGRDQSGQQDRSQRIHKRGSKYLRWAFVEAAIPATRSNLALKNLYDRVRARRGPKAGPNVAKVAVARKLAEIVYRLLVEERPYALRRT